MNESGGFLSSSALASREPVAGAAKVKLSPILGLGIVLLLGLLISAAWLVFPYLVKGQNLLSDVGGSVKKERLVTAIGYGRVLTQSTCQALGRQLGTTSPPSPSPDYWKITTLIAPPTSPSTPPSFLPPVMSRSPFGPP